MDLQKQNSNNTSPNNDEVIKKDIVTLKDIVISNVEPQFHGYLKKANRKFRANIFKTMSFFQKKLKNVDGKKSQMISSLEKMNMDPQFQSQSKDMFTSIDETFGQARSFFEEQVEQASEAELKAKKLMQKVSKIN
jgi:hypothetical protein